jgi:trk system potassium uptake protein
MIFELAPPNSFLGKTIAQLRLRSRYHIEVIAIRDSVSDQFQMVPAADFVIKDGEILVVVGRERDIQQIK